MSVSCSLAAMIRVIYLQNALNSEIHGHDVHRIKKRTRMWNIFWDPCVYNQPAFSSSKSKSRVFLIDLKKDVTGPAGTSSRELMVIPSIWEIKGKNKWKKHIKRRPRFILCGQACPRLALHFYCKQNIYFLPTRQKNVKQVRSTSDKRKFFFKELTCYRVESCFEQLWSSAFVWLIWKYLKLQHEYLTAALTSEEVCNIYVSIYSCLQCKI